jgi:hypothetical protein
MLCDAGACACAHPATDQKIDSVRDIMPILEQVQLAVFNCTQMWRRRFA